jgi:hypothetical protein
VSDLTVTPTEDDMLKVCLEEDGFKACCFVSSQHLVADKEKQLRVAILRQAQHAYMNENYAKHSSM